jgi:hypothetical protein
MGVCRNCRQVNYPVGLLIRRVFLVDGENMERERGRRAGKAPPFVRSILAQPEGRIIDLSPSSNSSLEYAISVVLRNPFWGRGVLYRFAPGGF